ncbi:hypothetical protein Ddye_029426 [Dipteronia dyeriana]|uniref:Protein root UVB sensitive/RUS domain-containing protein n=1 Tax=Dipteronia dyeriana TaxID=168575 RepID=A0AAD9WKK2_9ROSI|nr:hypothetical protein Ddye_029426 [Dipteronia dyeriana]
MCGSSSAHWKIDSQTRPERGYNAGLYQRTTRTNAINQGADQKQNGQYCAGSNGRSEQEYTPQGMAVVAARATRLPIYSSFAKQGNLSDLFAKVEVISTRFHVLGIGPGIQLASTVCSTMQGKTKGWHTDRFIDGTGSRSAW